MDPASTFQSEGIKEYPMDSTFSFNDQNEKNINDDNDVNKTRSADSILTASVCPLTMPSDPTCNHSKTLCLEVDGDDKKHVALPTSGSKNMNDSPRDENVVYSSISDVGITDGKNAQNALLKHSQESIDCSSSEYPFASEHSESGEQISYNLVLSDLTEKPIDSQEDKNLPETAQSCEPMPIKELSHSQQLSAERNEDFTSRCEKIENIVDVLESANTDQQEDDLSGTDIKSASLRIKTKVDEFRRTTRSSSGSLPKARLTSLIEIDEPLIISRKNYPCSTCKKSFSSRISLNKHVSNIHGHLQKTADLTNFVCPICSMSYKKQFGLKRHLTRKHLNVKKIDCLKCNYKAKNGQDYIKHIDKHEPSSPTRLQPVVKLEKLDKNKKVFKCCECNKVFKDTDARSIHTLNHKITVSLSHTEQSISNESKLNCNCPSSTGESSCMLHTSNSNSRTIIKSKISLNCLSQELKSEAEKSLDFMSKVAQKLRALSRSAGPIGPSPSQNIILLPTINQVSSLSSELATLTTTLGHLLLCKDQTNGNEVIEERKVDLSDVGYKESGYDYKEIDDCISNNEDELLSETESDKKDNKKKSLKKDISVEPSNSQSKTKVKRRKRSAPEEKAVKPLHACKSKSDETYVCQECGRKLRDHAGLKRHMMTHTDIHPFECKICHVSFRRKEHLKVHMVKHSEERPFKCEKCDYAAKTAYHLHRHSLTHNRDTQSDSLQCQKCSFKGRNAHFLSKHEGIHNPCSHCGHEAVDVRDYKLHKRKHAIFTCTVCNYTCHANWQLRQHTERKHNPSGVAAKRFCCELCGFICTNNDTYRYHMKRHENRTPFACEQCDYKCSSRASFMSHKLMHAGLKPYLCSFCGAAFRSSSTLNNHLLIHKDVKKHACSICGRRFRSPNNLKMHEMTHTGEKPFKCHLCEFACRRNKELRLHIEKHAARGEKDIKPMHLESQSHSDISYNTLVM